MTTHRPTLALALTLLCSAACSTTNTAAAPSTTTKQAPTDAQKKQAEQARLAAQQQQKEPVPAAAVVYFGFDASSLSDGDGARLTEMAGYLRRHPSARLVITGHADERGTSEYNLALGQARGFAARDYLVRLGVNVEQIQVTSLGEERPAVAASTEAAWAQNRRDELIVVVEDA